MGNSLFGVQEFVLTEEHVKLLRHANVSWNPCEFGAPSIDCKRPYGNGDVIGDMARILGVATWEDEDGENHISRIDAERLERLHRELEIALQVCLAAGTFEPGRYVAGRYDRDWRKA